VTARLTVGERLLRRRLIDPAGCWLWTGAYCVSRSGRRYGKMSYERRTVLVHRMSFAYFNGVWPAGEVDHACEQTLCFNPEHLRDMSHAENCWNHVHDETTGRFAADSGVYDE
jgi:hypothetical protein